MQLKKWLVAVPLAMTLLTGCSVVEKLVYRIDINQGNYVEQSAVDKLKFGMTKAQVRFVLGSPMLIENGYPNSLHTPVLKERLPENPRYYRATRQTTLRIHCFCPSREHAH